MSFDDFLELWAKAKYLQKKEMHIFAEAIAMVFAEE